MYTGLHGRDAILSPVPNLLRGRPARRAAGDRAGIPAAYRSLERQHRDRIKELRASFRARMRQVRQRNWRGSAVRLDELRNEPEALVQLEEQGFRQKVKQLLEKASQDTQ